VVSYFEGKTYITGVWKEHVQEDIWTSEILSNGRLKKIT